MEVLFFWKLKGRKVAPQETVEAWLEDSDYETINVVVREPDVTVTVAGSGELTPIEELEQDLTHTLGTKVFVEVKKFNRETESYPEIFTR